MIKALQSLSTINLKAGLSVGLCAVFLAGCGSTTDLAGDVISGGVEPVQVSPDTFAPPVTCPPLRLKNGTHLIRKFERNKEGDRNGLIYQALIEEWAASCSLEGEGRRIKLGIAGDVTPGPAWKGGDIVLPVRVTIPASNDPKEKPLVSELLQIPVSITATGGGQQWSLVEEKFVIPSNQGRMIEIGFDDGRYR